MEKIKILCYNTIMPKKFYKHEYKGKYKFIKKWYDDREGMVFEQQIDRWLLQFEKDEQEFLLECLQRYSFFRAAEYKYGQKLLYSKLMSFLPNWKEKSFIFKIYKTEASYSDNSFNDFWLVNNIKNECKQNIEDYEEYYEMLDNLIFIDDFIGSGNTIIKYLSHIFTKHEMLKKKKIVLLAMYLTNSAELALKNFAMDRNIDLVIINYKKGDKFFKEGRYYSGQQLKDKITIYEKICDNASISKSFRYGYENSQSLFTICDNTPNNTLSIFWENNENYTSLMHRYNEEKSPLQKMIDEKKKNKKSVKNQIWKNEIDSHQNLLFIGYCARKKTKFNFCEASTRFGLTQDQINTKINYAIDNEYLEIKDGKFVETAKFWNVIIKRKYKKYFEDFINGVFEEKTLDLKTPNYIPLNFDEKFQGYN